MHRDNTEKNLNNDNNNNSHIILLNRVVTSPSNAGCPASSLLPFTCLSYLFVWSASVSLVYLCQFGPHKCNLESISFNLLFVYRADQTISIAVCMNGSYLHITLILIVVSKRLSLSLESSELRFILWFDELYNNLKNKTKKTPPIQGTF